MEKNTEDRLLKESGNIWSAPHSVTRIIKGKKAHVFIGLTPKSDDYFRHFGYTCFECIGWLLSKYNDVDTPLYVFNLFSRKAVFYGLSSTP